MKEESWIYKNIGIIFNMDPSTHPGSHWMAMMIQPRTREFHYFDGNTYLYPNQYNIDYCDSYGNIHKNPEKISIPLNIQTFIYQTIKNSTFDDIVLLMIKLNYPID